MRPTVLGGCIAVMLPLILGSCGGADNHAQATAQAGYPQPQSAGAKLLHRYCSSCHGAPQPSAHTAAQWPNVVARMEQHRVLRGFGPMDPHDLERLIDYLQHNASEAGHTSHAAS